MHLAFVNPELLVLAPLVAAMGWLLLRKTRAIEHTFTILDFWPMEVNDNTGRGKQKLDWPRVWILVAATLATIALSSPRLQSARSKATRAPAVKFQASGHSLPDNSQALDLFLRAPEVPADSAYTAIVQTSQQRLRRSITASALREGIDIYPIVATDRINVTLQQANQILAHTVLRRLSGAKLIAGHFIGTPPSAFVRLFAAMPDVTVHGGMAARNIWIIHQHDFRPQMINGIPNSTCVLLGDTPGPGLSPIAERAVKNPASLSIVSSNELMHAVNLTGVRVKKLVIAKLDLRWHTLVACQGHPWLAERYDRTDGQTWLWLAGQINSAWSTWSDHASFVIFFTNVIAHIQQLHGSGMQADRWRPWPQNQSSRISAKGANGIQTVNLKASLAILACTCLLMAMSALTWRGCINRLHV